ncbi:hypothetical protein DPMN_029350 [Dreissena polymorpha]|uniref:Secreted protein n=1 Tax=Dreissena polymorpha TaxID=45954 RepID=A0A9D4LY02_DREPO|nr:hypothetical protein DPMN_029350 [Dreissena polymorpha]
MTKALLALCVQCCYCSASATPPCRVVPGLRRSCDGTMLHNVEPMGWTHMPDGRTMLSSYRVRGHVQTCSLR